MAWYRAGGGGIPAALKTGMNDVLNKKFGTSTTYAPNTWPDNVNLLGKLPEKTVSGAIAHIEDGADTVPVKAWGVTLPASLDGYSSLTCKQSGANLLLPNSADRSGSTNGIAYSYDKTTQTFSFNGTNGKTDANWLIFNRTEQVFDGIKIGATYYFSHTLPANMYAQITYKDTNNANHALVYLAGNASKNASVSFTIPSDFESLNNFQIGVARTLGAIDDTAVFMISAVASADYAPYEAPTTTTVSLGRTIYGGSADVVKGTGTEDFDHINMGSLTWQYDSANTRFFTVGLTSVIEKGSSGWKTELVTDLYTTASGTANDKTISEYASTGYVYIKDTDYSDPTQFKNHVSGHYLVYPLATATAFTFTPITPTPETALGVNNFWADEGDSQVTYRRDIDLALGGA